MFSGGKGGRCVRLTTLLPSSADCLKSGSLNLLEPSGPVQACNGIALPFALVLPGISMYVMYYYYHHHNHFILTVITVIILVVAAPFFGSFL
jgi:hypothetical protein